VGARERGKVMALFQAAFQIGVATGAFGLGLLAEASGYPAAFVTGGGCVLAALVLLAASPDGRGDPGARAAGAGRGGAHSQGGAS
jgi:predicted MFS family arabinose efflux permease